MTQVQSQPRNQAVPGLQMEDQRSYGQEEFWVIFNPSYHIPPKVGFWNRSDAESAANKMASRFEGEQFYVLKAVSVSVVNTVNLNRF